MSEPFSPPRRQPLTAELAMQIQAAARQARYDALVIAAFQGLLSNPRALDPDFLDAVAEQTERPLVDANEILAYVAVDAANAMRDELDHREAIDRASTEAQAARSDAELFGNNPGIDYTAAGFQQAPPSAAQLSGDPATTATS